MNKAAEILQEHISAIWDADDGMPRDYVMGSPLGMALNHIHDSDSEALRWLSYFVARRALPCWESLCEESRPRDVLEIIGESFHRGLNISDEECRPIISPHRDCLYSATQGAADAVMHASCYLKDGNVMDAIYGLSSADLAYDHMLLEDEFRKWLIEVAVPVSFEHREMSYEERGAFRVSQCGVKATMMEPIIVNLSF
ncbi:hypothetical protein SAMN02745181_1384 [Rubritalea squalenifaciens DSM 18772]|uniref:Uncharacterized protein n=1 Tax=Rubritalea squalenifaciens DSM 18772 TaxID=1123071 RepID=A0A1M6H724_9BACT|nr:hypothetical protein [Rubritalea squalenifaciens]SHJ18020.1 hypothetical protein SAMN02745181_1384 [Rubritalea squalenifaciens DSM 18772]